MSNKNIKINIESSIFTNEDINKIEKHYNAKYICDSQIKQENGNYSSYPASFFYTEKAHPEGSNYFALCYMGQPHQLMITNGICILDQEITGIVVDDTVYFSRYRHDFVKIGDYSIDGGRDYNKIGYRTSPPLRVTLKVEKDKLTIL